MNILFIHASNIVEPAASGIIRVTGILKTIFEKHGHMCYNAYYKEVEGNGRPLFLKSIKLTPETEGERIVKACNEWGIDTIISQIYPTKDSWHLLQYIKNCGELKQHPMVINCMHTNPYLETMGYTPRYLWYLLRHANMSMPVRIKKILWGTYCIMFSKHAHRKIAKRYQRTINLIDRMVMLSEKHIPEIEEYQTIQDKQLHFANNPVVYESYFEEKELEKKEKSVVFVGRLDEHSKRLSSCLRIWKKIEQDSRFAEWKFNIIGRGEDYQYYSDIIKREKLARVRLCGIQEPKEWYRKSSILLLTSAYEGWPMVINEAQQMGVIPVVFNSFLSVYDMINDGEDGCIVRYPDEQAFTETLKKLMLDDSFRKSVQINGLRNCRRFTEDIIYKQWEKILF